MIDDAADDDADARPARPADTAADEATRADEGKRIVTASWIGTTVLGVTTALAMTVRAMQPVALAVSVALFLAGTGGFFVAFVKAVDRSRTEEIGVMNLFFLDHSAPKPVKRNLLGSLVVQIAVATAAAAIRPNTAVAFAVLAPIYGLSLTGLWGALHGTFPPRPPPLARHDRQTNPTK